MSSKSGRACFADTLVLSLPTLQVSLPFPDLRPLLASQTQSVPNRVTNRDESWVIFRDYMIYLVFHPFPGSRSTNPTLAVAGALYDSFYHGSML